MNLGDGTSGGTWSSSNTGVATIGSTGAVGGILVGTSLITYSIGSGCNATAILTVNAAPLPITGSVPVCAGLGITLSDPTTGGTWVSGNTAIATVGLTSGTVTGNAISATITVPVIYTAPGGCTTITIVTINPLPSAITIPPPYGVCAGSTITLSDPGGGTWVSSNTSVATVGSASGIVGGIAALGGSVTVIYTLPTGCDTSTAVAVNPLPGPITGTASLCEGGATTMLSDGTAGGTWLSSNMPVATVNAFTGLVGSVIAGTATINYTLFATGCTITTVVTVNPAPPGILGNILICPGATSLMTDAVTGGTWSSSSTVIATVGSLSGLVTGGAVTTTSGAVITYTAPTGCSNTISIIANPVPPAIMSAGSIFHLCGGQSISLSEGSSGAWISSNLSVATATPGPSGSSVVTGVSPGVDTITFTQSGTGCARTATVTVNATPGPISGNPNVCIGSTTSLTDAGGGTWTSSAPPIASVGVSTGIVGGYSGEHGHDHVFAGRLVRGIGGW